jgi:hypothetical protein
MRFPLRVNRLVAALAVLGLTSSFGQMSSSAAAAPTAAQALASAQRGAQWIASQQESEGNLGSFGGDWSMTALAAVGVNAADIRPSPLDPSAQDYYLSLWTGAGPGGAATDAERAILSGYAGGLQTSRLDAHTNLLADLAAQFDGHQLGGAGATNADVFGLLALDVSGAPSEVMGTLAQTLREQQDPDGGWNFAAGAATSDVDMTGAAIAALCAAGASTADPALARALVYLHAAQDPATGGFVSASLGLNTDTTGWVTSGLRRCGIDPESWITAQGKTPLDFLLAQQNPDGSFQWQAGDGNEDLYATQDAVRPLAGAAFTAPAPARLQSGEPAVRPAPAVAAGTPVPMTLAIDSGGYVTGGSSVRLCKVTAPLGASVAQVLEDADSDSSPSYCVSDLSLENGRIARLNGVAGEPGKATWEVRREGGPNETGTGGALGLGALVQVKLLAPGATSPAAPPAPVTTGATTGQAGIGASPAPVAGDATHATGYSSAATDSAIARLHVHLGALTRVRNGRLRIVLSCPRGTGVEGCMGLVRVRLELRTRHGGPVRPRWVGAHEVHLAAGASGTVTIALDRIALRALRARADRVAWVVAAMRDPRSGAVVSALASTVLR